MMILENGLIMKMLQLIKVFKEYYQDLNGLMMLNYKQLHLSYYIKSKVILNVKL